MCFNHRQKKIAIFVLTTFLSCSGEAPDLKPCEEAFAFNRKVQITASTKVPYMKTCGLNVLSSKYLLDVYSQDISVDQNYVNTIYDELEIADHILSKHGIPYFIIAGTLLGAIRNGGLIPNDDDADIGILEKYEGDVIKLWQEFDDASFELNTEKFACGSIKVIRKNTNSNGLDIFPIKERNVEGQMFLAFARDCAYKIWPNQLFSPNAVDHLSRIPFGHLNVSSISLDDAVAYLNRAYGKDWYTETYKIWDHVHGKPGRRIKQKLLPTEYYFLKASGH